MLRKIGKLFGIGLALAILALVAGNQGQGGVGLGQAQEAPCTVTLTPGQSIQEAIDRASPGDVICLAEGERQENLVIGKSLTLRGAGQEKSVIKAEEEGEPVIRIESDSEIEVTLEGLMITEAKVGEKWTHEEDGILIGGKAIMIIRNSLISGNEDDGIEMEDFSRAEISGFTISGNGVDGIDMGDSSQATISGSEISGNDDNGIWMVSSSQATISSSTISGNRYEGIGMWDSSRATIHGNKIFENEEYGVALYQRPCYDTLSKFYGKVEGGGNWIHDNGKGTVCPEELEFLMTEEGGQYP